MDIELTPEQQQLEKDVFAYLKRNVPPDMEQELITNVEGDGPIAKRVIRQLGNDGWMGIGWPTEYGGQGRTAIEQYLFFDLSMGYFRIPVQVISLMMIGPTLIKVGSEEQKKNFLPPILTGDLTFAVGYTEPEAGTDSFSLKTTAVKDGNDYVINGQKTFTSMGGILQTTFSWQPERIRMQKNNMEAYPYFSSMQTLPALSSNRSMSWEASESIRSSLTMLGFPRKAW